jgi:hypothetical protein
MEGMRIYEQHVQIFLPNHYVAAQTAYFGGRNNLVMGSCAVRRNRSLTVRDNPEIVCRHLERAALADFYPPAASAWTA